MPPTLPLHPVEPVEPTQTMSIPKICYSFEKGKKPSDLPQKKASLVLKFDIMIYEYHLHYIKM